MFGVHDFELRYKQGALYSICRSVCHLGELPINEQVTSQMQQGASISFVLWHFESY